MTQLDAPPAIVHRPAPASRSVRRSPSGFGLGVGFVTIYLSLIVLIPLGAVVSRSNNHGLSGFWHQVTAPDAIAASRNSLRT